MRETAGSSPILLDDPSRCGVVLQGSVNLFFAELRDGKPDGIRHHVMELGPGSLVFGMDGADAMPPVVLMAVGGAGTEWAELDLAVVRAWPADTLRAALLPPALDRWVAALSEGMARLVSPRPALDALIAPGDSHELPARLRLGCRHGTAWLDTGDATPFLLDTEDVAATADGALLPLAAGAWISVREPASVRSVATADAIADGRAWPALARLHAATLDILPMNLRLAGADEANRLRGRDEADTRSVAGAFAELGAILGRPGTQAAGGDTPPARALAAVLHAMGQPFIQPASRPGDGGEASPSLDELLRANRLRQRHVRLDRHWWRMEAPPFLLLPEDGAAPLAILPRGGGGHDVFDSADGTTRRLREREAAGLRGQAIGIAVPLPTRALRAPDIGAALSRWSRAELLAMLLCGLAGGVLSLGPPIATGLLANRIIPSGELGRLGELGAALLLLAVAILGLQYAAQMAMVRIEGLAVSRLQAGLMDRLLRLPMQFFRDYTAGDLAKRLLAIQVMQKAVNGALIAALLGGAFSMVSVGLMFVYSPALALISLVLLLLFGAGTAVLGLARIRCEAALVGAGGQLAGLMLQLATAVAKLRLAAAEDRAFLRWAGMYARFAQRDYQAGRVDDAAATLQAFWLPFSTAVIFAAVYGLDLAPAGDDRGLQLGLLLAFLAAFNQTLGGMRMLGAALVQVARLKPLYDFASPVLRAVPEVDEAKADPGSLSGAIEVSAVTLRYAPGLPPVFQDLSLAIRPGEYVAIVGPSGAGKSTLLRLLLGFEQAEAGMVLFDGQDLRSLDVQRVRRQMGVVLQTGKLMSGSLLENILGPFLALPETDAWWAAEQVGLADDIRAMPMGMQTVITDAGGALSGGQVQRVMLARAIVARPRILLLDEATSALDNRSQSVVTDSLARLNATRIVIAHRLSTVMQADRVIVLENGAVGESGRFDELMASGTLLRRMAARQLL